MNKNAIQREGPFITTLLSTIVDGVINIDELGIDREVEA